MPPEFLAQIRDAALYGGTEFLDLIIQASEGITTRIQHNPPEPMRGRAENLVDPTVWHDCEDEQEFLGIKLHGTITTCVLGPPNQVASSSWAAATV